MRLEGAILGHSDLAPYRQIATGLPRGPRVGSRGQPRELRRRVISRRKCTGKLSRRKSKQCAHRQNVCMSEYCNSDSCCCTCITIHGIVTEITGIYYTEAAVAAC